MMSRFLKKRSKSELKSSSDGSLLPVKQRSSSSSLSPTHNSFRRMCNTELMVTVMWTLNLLVYEYLIYHISISHCVWPDITEEWSSTPPTEGHQLYEMIEKALGDNSHYLNEIESNGRSPDILRIALIGDPQLTDRHSYWFLSGKLPVVSSALTYLVEFFSDIFMRKSFQLLQNYQRPDAVFFLGDLMDSAKVLSEEEYAEQLERFQWIFESASISPKGKRYPMKSRHYSEYAIPQFYIPGNHDVGYDIDPTHQNSLIRRYEESFGPTNYEVIMKGVSFVGVNAMVLSPHSSDRENHQKTMDFIESIENVPEMAFDPFLNQNISLSMHSPTEYPRILFHHIPLWRPEGTSCGDLRSRNPALKNRKGYSYTNMLAKPETDKLLNTFKPILSFSGDDHDQCKVKHGNSTEYTVGTFSWLQGNPYPSYALLSVNTKSETVQAEVEVCFLPSQLNIYRWYALAGVVSVCILIADPLTPKRRTRSLLTLRVSFSEKLRILLFRINQAFSRVARYACFLFLLFVYLLWLAV